MNEYNRWYIKKYITRKQHRLIKRDFKLYAKAMSENTYRNRYKEIYEKNLIEYHRELFLSYEHKAHPEIKPVCLSIIRGKLAIIRKGHEACVFKKFSSTHVSQDKLNQINKKFGVSIGMRKAMEEGTEYGWMSNSANPSNYYKSGELKEGVLTGDEEYRRYLKFEAKHPQIDIIEPEPEYFAQVEYERFLAQHPEELVEPAIKDKKKTELTGIEQNSPEQQKMTIAERKATYTKQAKAQNNQQPTSRDAMAASR